MVHHIHNKNKHIQSAGQRDQNRKIQQLVTRDKSRFYYKTIEEISNVGLGKHMLIPCIIKPSVAVHQDQVQVENLHKSDLTKNSHEAANECNKYFNTIGNSTNPSYNASLQTNRHLVREFDAPHNLNTTHHPHCHQCLMNLN